MMSPHRHLDATTRRSLAHGSPQPARRVVSAILALATLGVAASLAAVGPAHAQAGDNLLFAFLKGLFGVEQRREPHRWRPPERRTLPRASLPLGPGMVAPEGGGATPPFETFRTMCVRLCDGYYWPVSFATTRATFERDARTCAQSCSGSAALYYYPNPGGAPEAMINLEGKPYKSLATAFLFRSTYDANCKCRPHPWQPEAIGRHKSYAKRPPTSAAARGGRRGR